VYLDNERKKSGAEGKIGRHKSGQDPEVGLGGGGKKKTGGGTVLMWVPSNILRHKGGGPKKGKGEWTSEPQEKERKMIAKKKKNLMNSAYRAPERVDTGTAYK